MSNICKFTVPASRDIETIIDYIAVLMLPKAFLAKLIANVQG
jgi:hypothetical protein